MIRDVDLYRDLLLFREHRYGAPTSYPRPIPMVRVKSSERKRIDCCTFIEGWILPNAPKARWSLAQHYDAMVPRNADGSVPRPLSPIDAYVAAGIADVAPIDRPPPRGSIVQAWRRLGMRPRGHTFFVEDVYGDKVLVLEANNERSGLDGVGRRGLGPIRDTGVEKPIGWESDPNVPTWSQLLETYSAMVGACTLRIDWSETP